MRGAITPHVERARGGARRACATRRRWTASTSCRGSPAPSATSGPSRSGAPPTTAARSPPPPIAYHVVAYDFGIKENILRQLRDVGCRVTVVPATTPARIALALGADGFFLSNGPGDPAAVDLRRRGGAASCAPAASRCSGSASATRSSASRSAAGPRSCRSATTAPTTRCSTGPPARSRSRRRTTASSSIRRRCRRACSVTHENLFDHSNEGIAVEGKPIFSVQYHPEASPGPHDASYLFARFREHLRKAT